MIGTSARPFSVSSYSTRGGTSGKVRAGDDALLLERAQPQRERARGDALERALQLAEARAALGEVADHQQRPLAADDVGGAADGTVGVRHATRHSIARLHKLKLGERDLDLALLGAADDGERQRAAAPPRARRRGRRSRVSGRPPAATSEVAALEAGVRRRGCRPRRRARAGRRARAARRRRAGAARRAAARARRRAAAGPAPRRRRAPRRARCSAASAGSARIRPPSRRTVLMPSRRPSASTSGPPEEPRGSGAECSIEPPMRRPRGPRNERPVGGHEAEGGAQAAAARGRRARSTGCPAPTLVEPGRDPT